MRNPHAAVLVLALLAVPGIVKSQEEPAATRPTPPTLPETVFVADSAPASRASAGCWRARPSPPCSGFWLTDFGVEIPIRSTSHPDAASAAGRYQDFRTRITWMIGAMGTNGRNSYGGAVSLSVDEGRAGGIAKVAEFRYRRWLGPSAALDGGLGVRASDVFEPGAGVVRGRGPTVMVALTPNRWIGVSARGDIVRARGRTHGALLLGLQSTRVSEVFLVQGVQLIWRALLARIGITSEQDE